MPTCMQSCHISLYCLPGVYAITGTDHQYLQCSWPGLIQASWTDRQLHCWLAHEQAYPADAYWDSKSEVITPSPRGGPANACRNYKISVKFPNARNALIFEIESLVAIPPGKLGFQSKPHQGCCMKSKTTAQSR